jgi:hypothetical protein
VWDWRRTFVSAVDMVCPRDSEISTRMENFDQRRVSETYAGYSTTAYAIGNPNDAVCMQQRPK